MAEGSVSRLQLCRVYQEVLVVQEDQEDWGNHHGHLFHGRPSQRGGGGSGCGQQWCELQGGSVTIRVNRTVVCVSVCVCCSANCSSPLMWEDQCVCVYVCVCVCVCVCVRARVCVCVLSLLLRCGALTCSHHKQQSHHQSKEQVHLHFAVSLVCCVRYLTQ